MFAASPRFLAAIKHSHTKLHRLTALTATGEGFDLSIEAGSIAYDIDNVIRTTGSITAVDPTGQLIPEEAEDVLSPFGAILAAERGIRFPDGTEEYVPLGRVRPTTVRASSRDGATVLALECFDEFVDAQEPMDRPIAIQPGEPVHEAVPRLLAAQLPSLSFRLIETPFTCPGLLIAEDEDAVAEAVKLARSAGCDIFIDRDLDASVCTMAPRPLEAAPSDVVWEFVEGENADFMDPERSITSEDVPNVVVVIGTHPSLGGGVRGEAADQDPNSPTYIGRYRKRLTVRSDRVSSQEHANVMAAGILSRTLGTADEVRLKCVPNPALTVGDATSPVCERLRLDGRPMLVAAIDPMPLDAETEMGVTLRRSIITGIEAVGAE